MSDWIHALADFHAEAGERVRKGINQTTNAEDFGTADLLTDILRALDLHLCWRRISTSRNIHDDRDMLYTLALILIVAWLLGFVCFDLYHGWLCPSFVGHRHC